MKQNAREHNSNNDKQQDLDKILWIEVEGSEVEDKSN